MIIEYTLSVCTPAGWRGCTATAVAHKISAKMLEVDAVTEIDGDIPSYNSSRTGAKRQRYNGVYFAGREVGKRKRLSAVTLIRE